ncbi:4'-phosphopantetheinyl transferase family protein [Psychrobacter sp. I-STPA10]|uniref:4'-phosphopantetheinyl transferase family protein n=1 Tax=Psychrobacter sp. I-STPA10 TaxID=2585769 RepID=UPI001E47C60D|nr:hypothetical protein [Psychrobacter sp. I-STPA10]
MQFITSQLFSFSATGQLTNSNDHNASIWLAVAEFSNPNWQATSKLTANQPLHHIYSTPTKLAKKQQHHYQQAMVRSLLNDMLCKLNITDQLDSQHYPYRLQHSRFYVCFSHSQTWVACAISKNHAIGIDIEKNPIEDRIAKRFFHPHILSQLATRQPNEQNIYKQLCWMLAESLLKKNNGKQLGVFLQQDYSSIISQLLSIIRQPMPCHNHDHNLANNHNNQDVYLIQLSHYQLPSVITHCSGIIYLKNLSVIATY